MPKKNIKKQNVRLPKHSIPVHYVVTLKPDLEEFTFSGQETISLFLSKSVKDITLHSKDLTISSARVMFGKKVLESTNISFDEKNETVKISFLKNIPKGKVTLYIIFAGVLTDAMRGFYKSKYTVGGADAFLAVTQFEATDARRCIPCFDEPACKATFDVNLVIPKNKIAISNTLPTAIIDHELTHNIVSFATTPKMSTYLLAFLVGDFEWLEAKTKNGVLVRVITVPGKKEQTRFALDVTVRCLEFYEEYFDIKYPLNTLDMIAVPDFSAGAMENWGAITFRESYLLVDENNTSTLSKESVAEVIAHELAHQWFGNLVTMEWWTHLWLNEGFASYIPYLALNTLFPEWNIWEKFITRTLADSMHLDALFNTHPIEIEVRHPSEIGEIFDAVSYSKGATVIRMLAEYLGEKHFRDGLRFYLRKHSYKNASTIDLWDAFEKVSKKPVKKMMTVWTKKSGYPFLKVTNTKTHINLAQKRYFSSGLYAKKNNDKTLWPIPISFVADTGEKNTSLMTKKEYKIPKDFSWLKLNAGEKSMYRVCYDDTSLSTLLAPVSDKKLSPEDRLGIIRDAFSFAESGVYRTIKTLEIALSYIDEDEYIVWVEIVTGLTSVSVLLEGKKEYPLFLTYARYILSQIVKKVGFTVQKNESHNAVLLRGLVLSAASRFGNEEVVVFAQKSFAERNTHPIHPDFRRFVYSVIIRTGDESHYMILLEMYTQSDSIEEKNRILYALGQSKNKKLLLKTLEFIMSDTVRVQDRNQAFAGIISNHVARELSWDFIKKNWTRITSAYGGDGGHSASRLVGLLHYFATKEAYIDVKTFFKIHPIPSAERTIQQVLEQIDSNIKWLARDQNASIEWLKNNKYTD